jgi:hypothetical protein
MGREIRKVPADWVHPTYTAETARELGVPSSLAGKPVPLFDEVFADAANEWLDAATAWRGGTHADLVSGSASHADYPFYWQWDGGPPDPASYRHRAWTEAEATHFQVYETVSEGTPVSPVLDSRDAVRAWCVSAGYSETAAARFATEGWAPSLALMDGRVYADIGVHDAFARKETP